MADKDPLKTSESFALWAKFIMSELDTLKCDLSRYYDLLTRLSDRYDAHNRLQEERNIKKDDEYNEFRLSLKEELNLLHNHLSKLDKQSDELKILLEQVSNIETTTQEQVDTNVKNHYSVRGVKIPKHVVGGGISGAAFIAIIELIKLIIQNLSTISNLFTHK